MDADKHLRAALPMIKDNPAMNGAALFYLGVANFELGKMYVGQSACARRREVQRAGGGDSGGFVAASMEERTDHEDGSREDEVGRNSKTQEAKRGASEGAPLLLFRTDSKGGDAKEGAPKGAL